MACSLKRIQRKKLEIRKSYVNLHLVYLLAGVALMIVVVQVLDFVLLRHNPLFCGVEKFPDFDGVA